MEGLGAVIGDLQEFLNNIFFGVPLYKLIVAIIVLFVSIIFRKFFSLIVVSFVKRLAAQTKTGIDDVVVDVISKPTSFLIIVLGVFVSAKILDFEEQLLAKVLKTLIIFVISWVIYNAVVAFQSQIYSFAGKFGKDLEKEIGAFLVRILKAFVFIVGGVAILQEWGINVSALIASLGLGGLAFALAAKDTAANLFGGMTVLADKSMKVGDWVKIGDVEGIVEDIGLRTTKIRTFEKSLITVPNQVLANQSLENFSRRKVRRIKMTVGLTYSTTGEQMRRILGDIRDMLSNHPRIAKDQLLMVYFTDYGASSLDIFIYCFTDTAYWEEYLSIREDVNLKIMDIVHRHGSSFAFPSRSIYVEKLPLSVGKGGKE